ncbi:hypothetical protein RJ55_00742 [Drechmeria coniospora]|nr:hypothetical protein RJ55_00742 [Drechmeria coniospora]
MRGGSWLLSATCPFALASLLLADSVIVSSEEGGTFVITHFCHLQVPAPTCISCCPNIAYRQTTSVCHLPSISQPLLLVA